MGMALALFSSMSATGADIDLFAGAAPTGTNAPYVLFVIDTGASFSASNSSFFCNISSTGVVRTDATYSDATQLNKTNGGVEQCALYTVINALNVSTTTVNIGVMFFNSGMKTYDPVSNTFNTASLNSNSCNSGVGGCLGMPIVAVTSTTKPRILEWIKNWTTSGSGNYNIKAPANRGDGATMQEAWAYFAGKTGISGRDYSGIAPPASCAAKNVIFVGNNYGTQASPKDATTAEASPFRALGGVHQQNAANANPPASPIEKTSIEDTIQTSCGTKTLNTDENKGAYALNWARYNKGQGVTTFAIGLIGPSCDADYAAHMTKMGSVEVGGGG